jgi:hypothetical protein
MVDFRASTADLIGENETLNFHIDLNERCPSAVRSLLQSIFKVCD